MNSRTAILAMAICFAVIETAYFGWNFFPQSEAELICDGIVFLLVALSLRERRKEDK